MSVQQRMSVHRLNLDFLMELPLFKKTKLYITCLLKHPLNKNNSRLLVLVLSEKIHLKFYIIDK